MPSMNRLLVGLGTGTYCIQAGAVFQGSAIDGLLFLRFRKVNWI